ncbi:hypothetical protein Patl1_12177 [Pistacia atlantica]|uniref:Uncharacterized protein n=1 Tax=Pistacia atlantica TaxID=434234 RepID=A0ACC1A6M9_9ROSI|nr:hypothetical protein Patl1_12177 [Pistacia atlantica]
MASYSEGPVAFSSEERSINQSHAISVMEHAIDIESESFSSTPISSSSSQLVDDLTRYRPLYKAILEGNLELIKEFCDLNPEAVRVRITVNLDTALHVAVGKEANHIVKFLLCLMSKDDVGLQNNEGNTALSIAAIVGNFQAAKMIMGRHPDLVAVANNSGRMPIIEAARHGQKKMIRYLQQFTRDIFHFDENVHAFSFLNSLIVAGLYDMALDFVKQYPSLAIRESSDGESLLSALARKPSAFPSGRKPDFWERYLCCVRSRTEEIGETKLMNQIAVKLVELLCMEITRTLDHERAYSILKRPFLLAAELGFCEVVKQIIKSFPDAVWFSNADNHNALQLAIMNRREKVFNLIFQMSGHKHLLLMSHDNDGNNLLHLAGKLAPENQLSVINGAALQMQSELRWVQVSLLIQSTQCQ